jgi:hypothetical protein
MQASVLRLQAKRGPCSRVRDVESKAVRTSSTSKPALTEVSALLALIQYGQNDFENTITCSHSRDGRHDVSGAVLHRPDGVRRGLDSLGQQTWLSADTELRADTLLLAMSSSTRFLTSMLGGFEEVEPMCCDQRAAGVRQYET